MQTMEINFEQLKHTLGCDLQNGRVANVFSPELTLWGHEIAGHGADPAIHRVQDALLADPKIATQFSSGSNGAKASALDFERLKVTKELLGTANSRVNAAIENNILEVEAVKVTDEIGRQVAAQTGREFTPRGVYFNGIQKNFEGFMKEFEGLPPERRAEIVSRMAKDRGIEVAQDVSPKELFGLIQQHDCKVLPKLVEQEMGGR